MALEAVAGAFLSSLFTQLFDKMDHEVSEFFKRQKLDDQPLKKLRALMASVEGVLDDAEEKQATKPGVKTWMDNLKNATYDAEDLFDEIGYEAKRVEAEPAGAQNKKDQVRKFISSLNPFNKGMEAAKLEEILGRFEYLNNEMVLLGLVRSKGIGEKPSSLQKVPTTSLVDEADVFGRDADKVEIIKMLRLSNDNTAPNGNNHCLGVIPIVGMAGVGKTTLAQLVYNDHRARSTFELKAWVFVSEEFDVFKVTKDILEEFTTSSSKASADHKSASWGHKAIKSTSWGYQGFEGAMHPQTQTTIPFVAGGSLNQLQLQLKEALRGKKFLLVLDDVWNLNLATWNTICAPLKFGQKGSTIIVTTCQSGVASVVSNVKPHYLNVLDDSSCWLLFTRCAFGREQNAGADPDLELIGRDIVSKCKGLPLAVKVLGGLLRSERDAKKWRKMLQSNMWGSLSSDNVIPALRLSYHYLPSHLKRCFAYCAAFPKDFVFTKDQLVQLWMAEGFLGQCKEYKIMKEVGDGCFDELVSRSFFQPHEDDQSSSLDDQTRFAMHDLVNDFAKYVSAEFCYTLGSEDSCKVTERTRHVSFARTEYDDSKKFEAIYRASLLRTFLPVWLLERHQKSYISSEVIYDLLPRLNRLRVLSLSNYDNVLEFPDSAGNWKHLRYLNLSYTSIDMLPHNLYNLQTLIVQGCKCLSVLPLGQLVSLKYLSLVGLSEVCKLGPEFYGSCRAPKRPFPSLEFLRFEDMPQWCEWIAYQDDAGAFPLLQELYIRQCPKLTKAFSGHLPCLSVLEIEECHQLSPSLPKPSTTSLSKVVLKDDFRDVKLERLSSGLYNLTVLRFLSLESLPEMMQDMQFDPSALERIDIQSLDSLLCFPLALFPKLKSLSIGGCQHLESLSYLARPLQELTCLSSLKINDCPSLAFFPKGGLPARNLTELELWGCSKLKLLPELMHLLLPSLMELKISFCPELESLPEGGLPSKLTSLAIVGCDKLIAGRRRWNLHMLPSLSGFEIGVCDYVYSFPDEMLLPSCLTSLSIRGLENLTSLNSKGLNQLVSLKELKVQRCSALRSSALTPLFDGVELLPELYVPLYEVWYQLVRAERMASINQPSTP